jgi:hypothetical protein
MSILRTPSGNGGNDTQLGIASNFGVHTIQKAHIFIAQIDVDIAAQLLILEQMRLEIRILRCE